MKKSLLSLSISAMIGGLTLAGVANAATSVPGSTTFNGTATTPGTTATLTDATTLRINAGGIGHIAVVPYFTTQNGNQTLLSLTNTDTVNGKLVKIRFRSAANSDDIFDFTLLMSPGDVWTANVSRNASNGLSTLTTTDNSCTLPSSVNADFVPARLPAVTPSFAADTRASWTREGYIEVLNTADIPPTTPLFTAVKHVNGVAPCTAAPLNVLLTDLQTEADLAGAGLDTPSGGLYTNAFVINTANAFLSWSTESTAIRAETPAGANGRGRIVFSPQTADPATTPSTIAALTGDPLLAGGSNGATPAVPVPAGVPAAQFDFPDLSTPYTGTTAPAALTAADADTQANGLSASIAVTSLANDFTTLAAIGAKTDFTFTAPTRRYAASVNYGGTAPTAVYNTGNSFFTPGNTTLSGNVLCVNPGSGNAAVTIRDRSEQGGVGGSQPVISPSTPGAPLTFCGEASVLTVNNPGGIGVLGATVAVKDLTSSFQEGWINIATPGVGNIGLPLLGSAYSSARGPIVSGTSTNFGWTFRHKAVLVPVTTTP